MITNMKEARECKHIAGVTFLCAECKRELPVQTSGGTGYGYDKRDKCVCYECCGKRDREDMATNGKAILYLVLNKGMDAEVVNWPGTLRFKCGVKQGRHNMAGNRYDVWFWGPDGHQWHGVTIGDNTQICHVKRTKVKAAA